MSDLSKLFKKVGIIPPDILIPNREVDLQKWAVVACDQYTSQPEYWESVASFVGESPTTLKMIYPESFLGESHPEQRIASINETMHAYIEQGLFTEYRQMFFLVKRSTSPGVERWGMMAAVDLDAYNYAADSTSLIRATEDTIVERIPPRKLIRKDAPLEFPHILVLIDDPKRSVIEPMVEKRASLDKVYETDLMKESGSVAGYAISERHDMEQIAGALEVLADPKAFKARYGSDDVLLFAMGDGNHSLATAKSCWEDIKQDLTEKERSVHPARYALVEIENIYDEGIVFEPIHRVLFSCNADRLIDTLTDHASSVELAEAGSLEAMYRAIHHEDEVKQYAGIIDERGIPMILTITGGDALIAAGTVQRAIDDLLGTDPQTAVDYTHGLTVTSELGSKPGNVGVFLPTMKKEEFFSSIVKDGALPRKTFSMGEAFEKRFYLEGRNIV